MAINKPSGRETVAEMRGRCIPCIRKRDSSRFTIYKHVRKEKAVDARVLLGWQTRPYMQMQRPKLTMPLL
eukprot:scaffold124045_cov30-Tisochrysis_lutea.AAC.2